MAEIKLDKKRCDLELSGSIPFYRYKDNYTSVYTE